MAKIKPVIAAKITIIEIRYSCLKSYSLLPGIIFSAARQNKGIKIALLTRVNIPETLKIMLISYIKNEIIKGEIVKNNW